MKFTKEEMIGKHILVGIRYMDADGRPERMVMHHGTIVRAEGGSVEYKLHDKDETVTIPYNPSFFQEADPDAVYTLAGTGEEVSDVDIVATFEVRKPKGGVS